HPAISSITNFFVSLIERSNRQPFHESIVFVVVVVDVPQEIRLWHTHAAEFDRACHRHYWENVDALRLRMRLADCYHQLPDRGAKLRELCLRANAIIVAVVGCHFPDRCLCRKSAVDSVVIDLRTE